MPFQPDRGTETGSSAEGEVSVCDECGAELEVGCWPFCGGDPEAHVPVERFGDDPITPYMDEMLGPEPVEIRTRGERRRIMSQNHLEYLDVSKKKRGRVYVDFGR